MSRFQLTGRGMQVYYLSICICSALHGTNVVRVAGWYQMSELNFNLSGNLNQSVYTFSSAAISFSIFVAAIISSLSFQLMRDDSGSSENCDDVQSHSWLPFG